ncbi:MAG: recombinase family protein [Microbacterium sp.]|uniref:recombinase family protein n=1 Tax=Microbacterium sp. TaxID=51671 RepID=UPI001ACEB9C1|nr:recombinase family protein [Microbacterium sp.]MBN9177829.1 recombinase family protein [Microbacterium sp.]
MNVVTYTRSAGPNSTEHEWQREACQKLAAELGYDITRNYHDEDREHPALKELTTDVVGGTVTVLLVARFDRISRSHSENIRISTALLDAGVDVYAANIGTYPLNSPSSFPMQIMAAMRTTDSVQGRYDCARGRRPRGRI